ncbi:MAG: YibE/F family protein [Treponema sp.]|nr:YibE/F family protein [Treponema sp.]
MLSRCRIHLIRNELLATAATFALIALIVLIAPRVTERYRKHSQFTQQFVLGTVIAVLENNIEEDAFVDDRYVGNQRIRVRINEGEFAGREFDSTNTLSALRSAVAYEGLTAVFAIRMDKDGKPVVWLYNYNRTPYVYLLISLLALLVVAIGHFKGLRSLLALSLTGTVLLYVVVPCMWSPHPALVAMLSLAASCIASFMLVAGFSKKAFCATAGTLCGIFLAGFLAFTFGRIMNLSGVDMEKGETLLYLAQSRNFKLTSLLFVSILIACLGATMDVAISIASSAEQLHIADSAMSTKAFFASVLAVGKDIIGTMTNTLILAFCGSSLPLAMMIWGYHMDYMQFINIPLIVINILQALASSIGMVASIFFTAIFSVLVFKRALLAQAAH